MNLREFEVLRRNRGNEYATYKALCEVIEAQFHQQNQLQDVMRTLVELSATMTTTLAASNALFTDAKRLMEKHKRQNEGMQEHKEHGDAD
jgi:hypothetical protein